RTRAYPPRCALLVQPPAATRALHSFPTRRSSDLEAAHAHQPVQRTRRLVAMARAEFRKPERQIAITFQPVIEDLHMAGADLQSRSEEHTSELQSRFDLVCRLLLEKKKRKTKPNRH